MGEKTVQGQSGGVNISGKVNFVGGDIVGRDKLVGAPSAAALDDALRPLIEAVRAAPAEARPEAETKLTALQQEAAKGEKADDGVIAKLVDGLVGLVPGAASAAISAFATPILGGIAGPVTGFVLDKIRANRPAVAVHIGMCPPPMSGNQSGGVNISGSVGSVGGDIVGGNKITYGPTAEELVAVLEAKGVLARRPASNGGQLSSLPSA